MGPLPLVRRMQAQWKLSRALGVANLLVLHRLSDLDAAGGAGSEIRAVADGLLADCATRIIYRQETDQLGPTATALGLTGPERELLPALPRGTGLWKLPGGRAHVVHHRLHPLEAAVVDTDTAMRGTRPRRGGRVSAGEPLARAEAATLGAVLLDPASLDRVRWLRGRDFTDPWHGMVFDLLRETSHTQPPLDPAAFGRALLDRHGPHRADLPRLVDLLTATPPRPQLEVYARMVLDASIRRDVASQGVLLRAGALQAALTGTAHPVTATTALVHAALDAGENRWNRATGTSPGDPRPATPAALAPALRHPAPALNADRLLSAHPALDPGQVAEHERDLIAALVSHPAAAAELAGWLRPEHLLDRRLGGGLRRRPRPHRHRPAGRRGHRGLADRPQRPTARPRPRPARPARRGRADADRRPAVAGPPGRRRPRPAHRRARRHRSADGARPTPAWTWSTCWAPGTCTPTPSTAPPPACPPPHPAPSSGT